MTRPRPAAARSRAVEPGSRVQAPAWTREPLIACTDGPLAHMWFTADDWQTRVTAAQRMHDAGQHRSPALDYVVDRAPTIPHPKHDVLGHAARYQTTARQKGLAA